MNLPVPELKNDGNIKESSSCPHSSFSVGPYSDNIGFGINDISNYKSICWHKYFQCTNGSILEIRSILLGQQALYMGPFFFIVSDFYKWRKNITPIAKKKFDTILSTLSNFLKNEYKLNEFLNSAFNINLNPTLLNHRQKIMQLILQILKMKWNLWKMK